MSQREPEVVAVLCNWLTHQGFKVMQSLRKADVTATRDGEVLVAEVKGITSEPGLDVDTLFGQILRRIDPASDVSRYAVVVPEELYGVVGRVHPNVLASLRISVHVVTATGDVRLVDALAADA